MVRRSILGQEPTLGGLCETSPHKSSCHWRAPLHPDTLSHPPRMLRRCIHSLEATSGSGYVVGSLTSLKSQLFDLPADWALLVRAFDCTGPEGAVVSLCVRAN